MRRLVIAFLLMTLAACVPPAPPGPTPLDIAEREYVDLMAYYSVLQDEVVSLSPSDELWEEFDTLQHDIASTTDATEALFSAWKLTGSKPDGFDDAWRELRSKVRDVRLLVRRIRGGQ